MSTSLDCLILFFVSKVAALFAQNVLKLHDRDLVFTAKFWVELFKLQGVKLAMSSAYHP